MKRTLRNAIIVITLMFAFGAFAQEHEAAKPQEPTQGEHATNPNQTTDRELSKASEKAVGPEAEEEEEYVQLKQSASVRWIAKALGTTPKTAYWLLFITNFVILFGAIVFFARKSVPLMLKTRTAEIQKGIEDARKASAEATARLGEIESRLAKLDGEISSLKNAAEADFSVEEARIKQQAEEDARHVVESAQQEIAAATRTAQRDLKTFASELAVSLAEKKIKVDPQTDEALVRGFVAQLGKDGQ
jgi:F-type H+-transporting ATPase subunit b